VIFHNDDLTLSVVTPVNDNYENYEDFSLSLMITYGDVNFLMIGCFGEISENDLLKTFGSFIKSDLLSLTCSEERNVPTTAFLQKVSSCYSVIQVFDKKLPKKSMINTMEILGSYVLRTDVNGNIKVTCNSKEITGIRTER
jgi:beta-lactamase superfamily II metal-dependent hydrolase